MKKIEEQLIQKLDVLINELESLNIKYQEFVNEANSGNSLEQSEVDKRMALARENKQRLDYAKAERDLLRTYL
jgi:hypothetical protein